MLQFSRWFVLITGIIWASYGIVAGFYPEMIHQFTGIGIDNWPAEIEVRAWYFQTEVALGILAYFGWSEPEKYLRINLFLWMVSLTILVAFRFAGTWVNNGSFAFDMAKQFPPFNYHINTAYLYELPSMLIFTYLWLRRDSIPTAVVHARA